MFYVQQLNQFFIMSYKYPFLGRHFLNQLVCKQINILISNFRVYMKAPLFPPQYIQLELVTAQGKQPIRYHNLFHTMFSVLVLSFSLWYFGYNLVQISCLPGPVLTSAFSSMISNAAVLGVLIGLITIGCMVGTVVSSYLVNRISRKKFLLLVNILAVIVGGVIQIPNIYALGVCRIFEGVIAGCYMQVIPSYISQITPKQIGWMFSHWPQILVVFGVDIAYIFQLIFTAGNVGNEAYWRSIFAIPIGVVIIQSFLVLFFVPDSPYLLLKQNRIDEAKEIFLKFYKEEYISQAIKDSIKEMYCQKIIMMDQDQYDEYKKQLSMNSELRQTRRNTVNQAQAKQIQKQTERSKLEKIHENGLEKTKPQDFISYKVQKQQEIVQLDSIRNKYTWTKTILGFVIAQSLHMTGILAVVTQAGEVQHDYSIDIGQITPVTITTVQLILTLVSIFVIRGMGIYMNIILALALMGIDYILNGIFFIFISWHPAISISFAIFMINMIIFGSSLGNSVGMATSELLHPKLVPYASAISWLGATFCIIALPIVMDALKKNGFPAFFFFGGWSLGSAIIILLICRRINLL